MAYHPSISKERTDYVTLASGRIGFIAFAVSEMGCIGKDSSAFEVCF